MPPQVEGRAAPPRAPQSAKHLYRSKAPERVNFPVGERGETTSGVSPFLIFDNKVIRSLSSRGLLPPLSRSPFRFAKQIFGEKAFDAHRRQTSLSGYELTSFATCGRYSKRREPPLLQCHPEQAIVCDCASKFCAVRHERNKTEERRRKAASDEGIYKGVSVSFRGRLLFRKGRRTINVHMRSRRFASPYGFDSATASRFAPLRITQHFSPPTSPSGYALTIFATCGQYSKRREPPFGKARPKPSTMG